MIYLEKGHNVCVIPKHYPVIVNRVVLKNNLSNQEYEYEVLDCVNNHYYYSFLIDIVSVIEGEYTYTLYNNNEVVDSGLLVVGECSSSVTEYEKNNTQKVYERN